MENQILKNRILFDPQVCVKCGYCKTNCPTYLAKKDERVSPRGRLLLSKKLYSGVQDIRELFYFYKDLDSCSKCIECERICPVGLKPWMNFVLVKNETKFGRIESVFAKAIAKSKLLFTILFWTFMQLKGRGFSLVEKDTPDIKFGSYRDKVFIFPTCFGYTFFKDTVKRAVLILRKFGLDAEVIPTSFSCCGAPIFLAGDLESFRKHAEDFNKMILKSIGPNEKFKLLVFGSTCNWILKDVFSEECNIFISNIQEISDYIIEILEREQLNIIMNNRSNKKILLHKPCHKEVSLKEFFKSIGIDFEESDFPCCGFGGSLMFKHWEMSDLLLDKLLDKKDIDFVVSPSPGCIMQLSRRKETHHFVDFLFDSFGEDYGV